MTGMEAPQPWRAADGTCWIYFEPDDGWTGWQPGEDGTWFMSDDEFRRVYGGPAQSEP